MLARKSQLLRAKVWFVAPIVALAIVGMIAVPNDSFWFTIFATILGFGLGIIPVSMAFRQVLEEVGAEIKSVTAPYFSHCTLTRLESDRQGYDIPWALLNCQEHLIVIGFVYLALPRYFRDELLEAIGRGVHCEVYILSQSNPAVGMRDAEFGRPHDGFFASRDLEFAMEFYRNLCASKEVKNASGSLTVWGYKTLPFFQAIAIDIDRPSNGNSSTKPSDNHKIVVTHTLFNIHANRSPTILLDQSSGLTPKYVESIQALREREDHDFIGTSVKLTTSVSILSP